MTAAGPSREPLRNVEINVGKTCNSRCVFCLDGEPTPAEAAFMPWPELSAELMRWRAEGYQSVGFLGGEPSIYPHIVRAVAYAHELGFSRIALASNAMRLARPELVDQLVGAGLTRVTVSMHGHCAELEDRLTGIPGAFAKKCAAIALLRGWRDRGALRDGLSVNAVLGSYSYRHLPRMLSFFLRTLGVDDLRVNFIRAEGRAEGRAALTPTFSDVVPVLLKAIALNEAHLRKVFTFGGLPLCVLPLSLLRSSALLHRYAGDAYRDLLTDCSIRCDGFRPDSPAGGVVQDGRDRFSWSERKRRLLKQKPEPCRQCELSAECEGVWQGYLELYGDAELRPLGRRAGQLVRAGRSSAEEAG